MSESDDSDSVRSTCSFWQHCERSSPDLFFKDKMLYWISKLAGWIFNSSNRGSAFARIMLTMTLKYSGFCRWNAQKQCFPLKTDENTSTCILYSLRKPHLCEWSGNMFTCDDRVIFVLVLGREGVYCDIALGPKPRVPNLVLAST
jgi:hypothetical protein